MLANAAIRGNSGHEDLTSAAVSGIWVGHACADADDQVRFRDILVDFNGRSPAVLPTKNVFG